MNPIPFTSEVPCCAHLKVIYKRIENPNGTCSDSWICSDCLHGFIPTSTLKTAVKEAWEEGFEAGTNRNYGPSGIEKSHYWSKSNARKIVEGEF